MKKHIEKHHIDGQMSSPDICDHRTTTNTLTQYILVSTWRKPSQIPIHNLQSFHCDKCKRINSEGPSEKNTNPSLLNVNSACLVDLHLYVLDVTIWLGNFSLWVITFSQHNSHNNFNQIRFLIVSSYTCSPITKMKVINYKKMSSLIFSAL